MIAFPQEGAGGDLARNTGIGEADMLRPDGEQDVIAFLDPIRQVVARQGDDAENAGIHGDTGRGDLAHCGVEEIDLADEVRDLAAVWPFIQSARRGHLKNFTTVP